MQAYLTYKSMFHIVRNLF